MPRMTESSVRIGDAERRVVDARLMAGLTDGVLTLEEYDQRAAVLWQARTRAELDDLVRDLPPGTAVEPAPPAPSGAPARRVVAVLSEDRFAGIVSPGQPVRGYALLGKAVVDLRREDLPDGVMVRVRAVLGEVEVRVPVGSRVELTGMTVLGDRSVGVAPGAGPVVHLDALALLGSVRVTVGDGSMLTALPGATDAMPSTGHAWRPSSSPSAGSSPVSRHGVGSTPHPAGARARLAHRVRNLGVGSVLAIAALGVVASGTDERVVFGSATQRVTSGQDDVAVSTIFGSVRVVVPDDVQVDTGGLVLFGSTSCEAACEGGPDQTVIDLRSIGAFSSVEVLTESEAREERERAEQEAERERLEELREDRDEPVPELES